MSYLYTIEVDEVNLDVHVFFERRKSVRFGFGKNGLLIRIPNDVNKNVLNLQIKKGVEWGKDKLLSHPDLLQSYRKKTYENGTIIQTFQHRYEVIRTDEVSPNVIKIKGDCILSHSTTSISSKDISRLLIKVYKPIFEERLAYWAELFPVSYQTMRIKYNSSNWGSCSSKQNINLSSRLFLCSMLVIDYVMVHELAHLIHHNHSKQFWELVERIMPDYAVHDQWLKVHGFALDF